MHMSYQIWIIFEWIYLTHISKIKLVTLVEGNQKAPFSIATTLRCRGGCYTFPWIPPLYPWYIPYIVECQTRRYQVPFLKSLVRRNLGLNPDLLDLWRTLYPLGPCVTTSDQNGPGSKGNEGVFHTLQMFRTGASPSDAA